MGELIAKMRSFLAQAALSLSVALVLHAQFGMADWNVNVGSNINSAPVVVNDPLLDFGAVYVSDYAQHRVCECFYNGTCRDFVQKGSGGLKWPWGLEFGHHDNGRGQNTGWDDRDKMYVASEGTNSIILYNAANGVLKKSPFANVPGSPRGVKYFRQSIYVASYHKHAVYRFNARTGAPQGKFTHAGPTLFRPLDLEFDPFGRDGLGGNLYVSSQNSVFQYERHSGSFINQWSKDLRLNSVAGISFRRNDPTNKNLFVTGPYMGKVWVAHSVPKKLGTMVVGPRQELFVADKDEIRRYDGNTGEFISVYARYDGMDATFMHFNQLDQPDCYGASCPVQTCSQCANLNTMNQNKHN